MSEKNRSRAGFLVACWIVALTPTWYSLAGSSWHPAAEEYFAARAPNGRPYNGSSTLRSFRS